MKIVLKKRIQKLLSLFPGDAILITSPKNRYYFSGFTGTEANLLLTNDAYYIFTDSRYHIQAKNEAKDFTLIDTAKTSAADFIREEGYRLVGFEEDTVSVEKFRTLSQKVPDAEWEGVSPLICSIRKIKDETEVAAITRAAEIADRAFSLLLPNIKPGKTEQELALELEFTMRKMGASGLSFDTIFASGVRSAMPHGVASDKKIEYGDFVTVDFGCVFHGYCSDMTRTVVVGKANEKQKEIYDIVLSAQTAALAAIRPGAVCKDIDAIARGIITDAGYGAKFGHGLGHSLGLDIHELPSFSPRCEETLAAGMLMTDEPGIYIEGFGGVRIEDLVLVTEDGCQILSHTTKELIEL